MKRTSRGRPRKASEWLISRPRPSAAFRGSSLSSPRNQIDVILLALHHENHILGLTAQHHHARAPESERRGGGMKRALHLEREERETRGDGERSRDGLEADELLA